MKTIKKVSVILVCIVLLTSTVLSISAFAKRPNSDEPTTALPWRGSVTLSNDSSVLNVRRHPVNGSVLGTLQHDHRLHINGRQDNWWRVHYNGSVLVGFVSPDFVTLPLHNSQWVYMVSVAPGTGLNFRAPNINSDPLGVAPHGERVLRNSTNVNQGFRNVVYRGLGAGWMHENNLVSAP